MKPMLRADRPLVCVKVSWCMVLAAVLAGIAPSPASAQQSGAAQRDIRIEYLSREGDAAYAEVASDDGVYRAPPPEPFAGAELAIRDTRATAHAVGATIKLERHVLAPDADAVAAARQAADGDAAALIVDLPLADLEAIGKALPPNGPPVFNIRHPETDLRAELCGTNVFHVLPSTAMLTDALAQFLVKKNWKQTLVLVGPLPADKTLADSFAASAKKFGARISDTKSFVFGNDPRQRDQTNVALMTASSRDYDALFLADTTRDFGRFVPYQQSRPRPVVGTEGLQASAWDAIAERYGAPQVNHRFERTAHRPMTDGDWAAWVAVRSVVEAITRGKAKTGAEIAAALVGPDVAIDVSKGVEGSYRRWDHQFRQSIMLTSGDAVVEYAPFEGFLHPGTTLDTLGVDEGESPCKTPVQ
ncbi:ABC transporter substrate-binding protein [Lichenifustis flavocetrariae]|uniref:ABC transporter substrate-binding protein n=1 Tax=Lichenifustis flavocetrariae TaxID=2949735 RepID=A0AA42CGW2_9HYPH|nr:ABC transporter substrate-binding protein [Lichenifustis flavocetrariae]MCW6506634.1 ABC transporter substrate-binding protein [Lichenifustis flavocetrariae]